MVVAGTESGGLRAQLAVLRRRRRLALLLGGSIALLFVLLAVFLPSMYRSTATILIEEPDIPANLVRSTITSFGDKRIETIYQRVMTGENLLQIVREYELYPRDQKSRPREVLISRMRDDLGMEIVSADSKSVERDYELKRRDYAEGAIKEYWIVDPQQQLITVLSLENGAYAELGKYRVGDQAASKVLPGFVVELASLFKVSAP